MELYLREATIEDAEDMLRWRNDPSTRENSFSKDIIDLKSHVKWLEKKLALDNCHIFILMAGDVKAGSIRVDVTDEVGEISYMIAPEHRGKGFGKKIIGLVEQMPLGDVKVLTGFTLKENVASGKCFLANGYTSEDAEDAYCYSKTL